jgi:hypothetical protein
MHSPCAASGSSSIHSAVRHYLNEPIEVIVATSSVDGLPETSEANAARNQET